MSQFANYFVNLSLVLNRGSMDVTFQNIMGGRQRAKSVQGTIKNPDGIGFLFEFDPFSYQHWGSAHHWGAQPNIGVSGPPKEIDIKLRPL